MVAGHNNFEILADGRILGPGGKEVVVKRRYAIVKDNGRPDGNVAGLPATRGIDGVPGVGQPSKMDKTKTPRFNGRFGDSRNNTVLTQGQRKTELVETDDLAEQREAGERFEEQMSVGQRNDRLRTEIVDGVESRAAEAEFNNSMGLSDYDH